ncbi:MAG: hypothetical protein RL499_1487 [Actinomycetota bacterium]
MNSRVERSLAYMVAAIILMSIGSLFAVLVGVNSGLTGDDFAQGVWPTVVILPLIGLPIGFMLIIVLLVVSAVRRGRAAKDASN